jgi:hypothetical protein
MCAARECGGSGGEIKVQSGDFEVHFTFLGSPPNPAPNPNLLSCVRIWIKIRKNKPKKVTRARDFALGGIGIDALGGMVKMRVSINRRHESQTAF